MGIYATSSVDTTDLDSNVTTAQETTLDTEASSYQCNWSKWHGIYRENHDIQAIIDRIAMWTCLGIKAKEASRQAQLDKIKGFGKDTINSIAFNLNRTMSIGGDAIAEIVKDKRGALINLKPLSPGVIRWNCKPNGIIEKYEQVSNKIIGTSKQKIVLHTWNNIDDIFHLPWNRIADENHGISTIQKLYDLLMSRKDGHDIMTKFFRRIVFPPRAIEADSDKDTDLDAIKTKYQNAVNKGEVMVYPKDSMKLDLATQQTNIEDSITWLQYLQKQILLAEGCPEVILGIISSNDTEGASKILYLAFQTVIKFRQKFFKEQWKAQLGFEIELEEPPSIDPMVMMDARKAGSLDVKKGNDRLSDVSPGGQNK